MALLDHRVRPPDGSVLARLEGRLTPRLACLAVQQHLGRAAHRVYHMGTLIDGGWAASGAVDSDRRARTLVLVPPNRLRGRLGACPPRKEDAALLGGARGLSTSFCLVPPLPPSRSLPPSLPPPLPPSLSLCVSLPRLLLLVRSPLPDSVPQPAAATAFPCPAAHAPDPENMAPQKTGRKKRGCGGVRWGAVGCGGVRWDAPLRWRRRTALRSRLPGRLQGGCCGSAQPRGRRCRDGAGSWRVSPGHTTTRTWCGAFLLPLVSPSSARPIHQAGSIRTARRKKVGPRRAAAWPAVPGHARARARVQGYDSVGSC